VARDEYRLIDVFPTARCGGTPLAVFPDAAGIDAADGHAVGGGYVER